MILNDLAADPNHAATPFLSVVDDDMEDESAPVDVSFSLSTARLLRRWDLDLASVVFIFMVTLGWPASSTARAIFRYAA